jgi:glycosyltransferase involved in cell wall biosynthesis
MTANPFFSILTASLNSVKHIKNNIESIKRQRFRHIEHVVVDGGSKDGTSEVLRKAENNYPLRWISEPDKGISDALNKGLLLTRGRYILVLQTDDALLDSETLMAVFSLLHNSCKEIYSFPVVLDHSTRGRVLRKPIRHLWYNRFKFILPHQGCFVSRRLYDAIGNFRTDLSIAMDYDFFYRALKTRRKVGFGNFPVALMGGSGIGSNDAFVFKRLWEERQIQKINEDRILWRIAQLAFRSIYLPYRKLRYRY